MDKLNNTKLGIVIFIGLALIITLVMAGCPIYHVYQERKNGEALLAHAQYSREVAVAEAKAKMEASSLLAEADTLRAHGIARSNAIIGESLRNNPSYLQWLWIDQLKETKDQIIYVPSGGLGMPLSLPVTEATRLNKPVLPAPEEDK